MASYLPCEEAAGLNLLEPIAEGGCWILQSPGDYRWHYSNKLRALGDLLSARAVARQSPTGLFKLTGEQICALCRGGETMAKKTPAQETADDVNQNVLSELPDSIEGTELSDRPPFIKNDMLPITDAGVRAGRATIQLNGGFRTIISLYGYLPLKSDDEGKKNKDGKPYAGYQVALDLQFKNDSGEKTMATWTPNTWDFERLKSAFGKAAAGWDGKVVPLVASTKGKTPSIARDGFKKLYPNAAV